MKTRLFTKSLLLFALAVSPMGAQALSIDVGSIRLSLFRITIMLSTLILFSSSIKNERKLLICNNNDKYSVLFMLAWFSYAVLTVFWAKDYNNWLRNLYFLMIAVLAIILMINLFHSLYDIIKAFLALQIGIFFQTIVGWYEVFTRDYHFIEMTEENYRAYMLSDMPVPIAMLGNPNDFATLMLIGIIISFICWTYSENRWIKIIFCFLVLDETILLFLTFSRANFIGLFISLSVFLIMKDKKRLLWIPIIVLIVLLIPGLFDSILDLFGLHFDFNQHLSGSEEYRINLIKNGFVLFYYSFGFGVGCGQIESWMIEKAQYNTGGLVNMHNWWMEILTGYGLLIFCGYILFYKKMLQNYYSLFKTIVNPKHSQMYLLLFSLMIGYIVACMSSSSNITSEYLWVFWAICITLQGLDKDRTGEVLINGLH